MKTERKLLNSWLKELDIKIYSGYLRKLEENDFHVRKLSATEFIKLLKKAEFTFDNRNTFNKKLMSFSNKNNIKEEMISKLLELRKDDFVKFKINSKVQIGRYQGEINGKDLLEIEVNGNGGALNYFYVKKNHILFPTRREISLIMKKEMETKSKRVPMPVQEIIPDSTSFLNYYD